MSYVTVIKIFSVPSPEHTSIEKILHSIAIKENFNLPRTLSNKIA